MKRLPDDIKRAINRAAHALAHESFGEHRQRLQAEVLARLKAGEDRRAVLAHVRQVARESMLAPYVNAS